MVSDLGETKKSTASTPAPQNFSGVVGLAFVTFLTVVTVVKAGSLAGSGRDGRDGSEGERYSFLGNARILALLSSIRRKKRSRVFHKPKAVPSYSVGFAIRYDQSNRVVS